MPRRRWLIAGLGVLATLSALVLLTRALQPPQNKVPSTTTSTGLPPQSGEDSGDTPRASPTWHAMASGDNTEEPERPLRSMPPSANPFAPPTGWSQATAEVPKLRLEGIAQGAAAIALISGRRVRVGESIEGYQLLAAGERQAELFAPAHGHLRLVLQGPPPPEVTEP